MHFSPQPFSLDWDLEQTQRYQAKASSVAMGMAQTQWRKALSEPLENWAKTAPSHDIRLAQQLGGHVAWVLSRGIDVLPANSASLNTPFFQAVRELADHPQSTPAQLKVGRYFMEGAHRFLFSAGAEQAHQALLAFVDQGNVAPEVLPVETCQTSGEQVSYRLEGWRCAPTPALNQQEPSLRPFSQRWLPGDTRQYLEKQAFPRDATYAEQDQWRREVARPMDDRLAGAVGEHVAWLLFKQADVLPDYSDALRTPLMVALRELAKEPENKQAQLEVGRFFLSHLSFHWFAHNRLTQAATFHDQLVDHIESGNFKQLCSDDQTCSSTGLRVNYNFNGWKAQAGQVHIGLDPAHPFRATFEPLTADTLVAPQTYTATIPVPSGKLLIGDWIRLKALNALAEPVDNDEPPSALSSTEGRAQRSLRYAQRLGMVHVFVRSPSVMASLGAITAGDLHRDPETGEAKEPQGLVGKIDADLRWTTIVDRQHLVSLLTPSLGAEEAERQVKEVEDHQGDYRAQGNDRVLKVSVNPGTHHLYFAGDEDTFAKTVSQAYASDGLFLEEDYRYPGFALTETPLAPATQPKPKRRRSP